MTTWTSPTLASDPAYRAFVRAMEAAPEDRTARAIFGDFLEERGYPAEAAAFRASAEDATEYAPGPVDGGDGPHPYHVRRYHDADRTSYTFVGIWPTLLEAVSAFVRWYLRGEFETKCGDCTDTVTNEECASCKGSRWVPICECGNCEQPGEACGGGYDDQDEPTGYFCDAHMHAAGNCRMCRQFFGAVESFEFGNGFCDDCAWEIKHDADHDDEEDFYDQHEREEDYMDEDYP